MNCFVCVTIVDLQTDRPLLRQLPDEHNHLVAQERGGGAGVQRMWALHEAARGEFSFLKKCSL